MRNVFAFVRGMGSVVTMAIVFAWLLAVPSQARAANTSAEVQALDESTPILLAGEKMDKGSPAAGNEAKKPPCEGPPGACYSINVVPGDGSGCTSGSKCTAEGMTCNPGKKCTTVKSGGVCFCACR